ncbi:MAG: WYL domain-containing protein [Gemmatimonadota bacterium]|nr:WYL domain-containing protein [Gemmatimonadota bacterium]
MPSAKRPAKVQRWIDLITALLRHAAPISFDTLAHEVPAYSNENQGHAARMRMFERDKDELRLLGVPIESVEGDDGQPSSAYVLKTRSFYLPYVSPSPDGLVHTQPNRPQGPGYQGLPVLAFAPDQLAMVARAAARVQQMRHASLAADAATAMRKLSFDVSFAEHDAREVQLSAFRATDAQVLDALDHGVRRRKHVTFDYRSIERDVLAERQVSPYGLLFISGIWYLLAHDEAADALRHFRVSRISNVRVNSARAQSPDFSLPAGFDLWAHAESRRAWELGDGDATTVTVHFEATSAYAVAGAELGEPADDDCRTFVVRRPEAFVRWLLSFGGAARPLAPASIVSAWTALARQTAAQYQEAS